MGSDYEGQSEYEFRKRLAAMLGISEKDMGMGSIERHVKALTGDQFRKERDDAIVVLAAAEESHTQALREAKRQLDAKHETVRYICELLGHTYESDAKAIERVREVVKRQTEDDAIRRTQSFQISELHTTSGNLAYELDRANTEVGDLIKQRDQLEAQRDDLLDEMAKGPEPDRVVEALAALSEDPDKADRVESPEYLCAQCGGDDRAAGISIDVNPTVALAISSLHAVMATWSGDWSTNKGLAWIYAVVVGWGPATEEVAGRFGWTETTVGHIADLHGALADLVDGVEA